MRTSRSICCRCIKAVFFVSETLFTLPQQPRQPLLSFWKELPLFLSPFSRLLSYWLCLLIYTMPFEEQLGTGGGKATWNVNAPSPNCRLVSSVLYIYDYEAICIKFTPFQILKIALLRKNRCTFSIQGWLITVLWRRHNIFIKLSVSRKMNTSWNNHTNVISECFHLQRASASSWASGPSHLDQSVPSGAGDKPCPECDGTLSTSPSY